MLKQYNGLGYANKGRPLSHIWSGTDQYVSGKYVRGGVYDPISSSVAPVSCSR
ncbi:lysozyme family protein [Bradyrhizobium sp. JR6.1]